MRPRRGVPGTGDIREIHNGALPNSSPDVADFVGPPRKHRPEEGECVGTEIVVGGEMEQFPIEPIHRAELGVAELHRAPRDGVEHGLDVSGRARDHTQDLAGGRLLLERVAQSVLQICR
jgi:hypothetical protein